MFFTCCKKDPQINPPEKVIANPPSAKIVDSIFPNPCNLSLTISTNSTSNQTVKMVDMLGRVRINLTINQTTIINTDSLQVGIYYVTIANSTGATTKKIIVQH
jgi:hypothetical protein